MNKITLALTRVLDAGSGGQHLLGREIGRRLREALADHLQGMEPETVVHLDFSGVESIDYSCADEMLAKLVPRLLADEFGRVYVCLVNLSRLHSENVAVALEKRGLALPALTESEGWTHLGKLNPYLRETFDLVYDYRSMNSRELSEKLRLALNTGSTRLINLHKKRLVHRRENLSPQGSREFVYVGFNGGFGFA